MAFPASATLPLNQRISIKWAGYTALVWDIYRTEKLSRKAEEQGAVWTCQCLWEDRYQVATALIGGTLDVSGTYVYSNGFPYPDNPAWIVKSIDMKPYAPRDQSLMQSGEDEGDLAIYPMAELTVNFGVPDYTQAQTPNIGEQELDWCNNTVPLTQNITSFYWDDGTPLQLDQNVPIKFPTIRFTQTLFNRPSLNVQLFTSLINKVNSEAFFGAPAGTVLFQGPKSSRKLTPAGALNWDIILHFEWNGVEMAGTTAGWNKQWRTFINGVGNGWYDFFTDQAGTQTLFSTADLNSLLTVNV